MAEFGHIGPFFLLENSTSTVVLHSPKCKTGDAFRAWDNLDLRQAS